MADWKPAIINSFQGAFGPPTRGHYEAMKMATNATIAAAAEKGTPDANILMLFMPTAKSSAKPHLEPTQQSRLAALNVFCNELKKEFPQPNIHFEASNIEFLLWPKTYNSATIFTLVQIYSQYGLPKENVYLTMGRDNLFELPFWKDIQNYDQYINGIFVTDRTLTDDEKSGLSPEKTIGTTPIQFSKKVSWADPSDLEPKLAQLFLDPEKKNRKVKTESNAQAGESLQTILGNLKYQVLAKPPSTSSTLLRGALKKFYSLEGKDWKFIGGEEGYAQLKQLIGDSFDANNVNPSTNPWLKSLVELEAHIASGAKAAVTLEKNKTDFAADYALAFPAGQGGGSRRRKSRKNNRRTRRR